MHINNGSQLSPRVQSVIRTANTHQNVKISVADLNDIDKQKLVQNTATDQQKTKLLKNGVTITHIYRDTNNKTGLAHQKFPTNSVSLKYLSER